MPSAVIRVTPKGSSSSFRVNLVYNYFSANTWTAPGKPGGEWDSYSSANVTHIFNGEESTDKPVWLKLYKFQWDISNDLEVGMTGLGVLCATFKAVDWEVLSC